MKKAIFWLLIGTLIFLSICCFLIYERLSYAADTCVSKVPAGKSVTLTAKACPGSRFVKWGGACSGTFPICTFTMNSDMNVSAEFELIPYPEHVRLIDLLTISPEQLYKCKADKGFIEGL